MTKTSTLHVANDLMRRIINAYRKPDDTILCVAKRIDEACAANDLDEMDRAVVIDILFDKLLSRIEDLSDVCR